MTALPEAGPAELKGPGQADTRCGFVALLGAPNVGKSTLTNQLVGAKISIVTHKVQTTRSRIRGIVIEGASQIVIVDAPGIFAPKRRLDRAMVEAAWTGAREADMAIVLIDAQKGIDEDAERIIAGLGNLKTPVVLALNKIDLVAKPMLPPLAQTLSSRAKFERVFMISATSGDGVADLRTYLAQAMPPGPWLYPEDEIADTPMRHTAAEITREKLYLRLHEELPYASTVETTDWKELADGSVRIEQTIFVERDGQKKIVLGKGGQAIKQISTQARREIGELLDRKVHLFLFVKVRSRWGEDPERYSEMGLDYPRD